MKNLILLFVFACIFAGCKSKDDPVEPSHKVIVFFSAKSNSTSLLKSDATDDEKKISRVILYGVDAQNAVIENYAPVNNPPLTGIQLTVSGNVKILYAIANPSEAMLAAVPSNLFELMAMTGDFTDAPRSPFLMGGNGVVNNSSVNIEFIRAVAKISFIGMKDFAIGSIAVENAPDEGYVFSQGSPAAPVSSEGVNYGAVESPTPTVYVAENTKQDPARFVVTGMFDGKLANYAFALSNEGLRIDIARNTHYQVSITPKTENECTITVNIPEWNDGETDVIVVPDNHFSIEKTESF